MKYRVAVVRYGFVDVDADDRAEAVRTANRLRPENIEWTDGWMPVSVSPAEEREES